jgi:hypothetical protein
MNPLAHELLAARARRVTLVRKRVVAATLSTFVLAWGAIVYDGSMGATTTVASTATTATPKPDTSSRSSSDDTSGPLTTSQS